MIRVRVLLFLATLALGTTACFAADPAPAPSVIALGDDARQLREDFNQAQGSIRLVLVVDPACSVCLRGMADVNEALLATTTDPRLQTFVVHVPVIGATAKDVPLSMELLHNPHVRHYWNASGSVGHQVSVALQLKRGEKPVYAWDVWMIYGADAAWPAGAPPTPALFMHQLPALRGQPERPFLDSAAFAAKALELLARLPPTEAK